jgi:restriction endonuclease S subunit
VSNYVEAKDNREVVEINKLNTELKNTVDRIDKLRDSVDEISNRIGNADVDSFLAQLLEGSTIDWTVLGDEEFAEIANGGRKPIKASLREPVKTPYYGANNIQDYVQGHTHDGEFVLIAEDGTASVENYSIQYVTGKFWANNHVHVVRGKSALSTRFLFHYLRVFNFIPYLSGGGRAKLTKGKLIEIPVPVLQPNVQAEIVRILDAFTSLSSELGSELTSRNKQFDYYRHSLLSFPKVEV